jgi:hypothetical protein
MNTIKSALKQSKFLQQSESLNFQVAEDQLGQRRVSFQSGRPPVHKEGARLQQLRQARQLAQSKGAKLAGWGASEFDLNAADEEHARRNGRRSRPGIGSENEGADERGRRAKSRMERLQRRKGTGRVVKARPFTLVMNGPANILKGGHRYQNDNSVMNKNRSTAMVIEELDFERNNNNNNEHSAAQSRDGDRAGSFAENSNNTSNQFYGYDLNGNRTMQPMFRPKSPGNALKNKNNGGGGRFSMEMNSQLRALREQHMQEGGVLAEAAEEEKRMEQIARRQREGTPMAAETLVNMFNIPRNNNAAQADEDASPDDDDWQGVSHMARNDSAEPQVRDLGEEPQLNGDLNNDDDEFGGGFDGADIEDDEDDDQFAGMRNFDEEGFPVRAPKPVSEPHKRLRDEMERRKSLAYGGLQEFVIEDAKHPGAQKNVRKSSRQRQKPLEYWRGEKKEYERVHASLPTIKATQRQTRNKLWPRKTPGGPSETFRVLKLRPTEQFNKIGAVKRDSMVPMTARNGAPLYDSEDDEIYNDEINFDQHGRRIKTYAKTPKEYYGKATPAGKKLKNQNGAAEAEGSGGKKKRGRPRKNHINPLDIEDDEEEEEEYNRNVFKGKHVRLMNSDDEEEEEERDEELEENTRRNSEAVMMMENNSDDEEEEDEDEKLIDAAADKAAREATEALAREQAEELEEEARKALKAEAEMQAEEARIDQEEIQEEEETTSSDDDEDEDVALEVHEGDTPELKKKLADAAAELEELEALGALEETRALLDRHDERDNKTIERFSEEESLQEVDEDGKEIKNRFSMDDTGKVYDEEADKQIVANDPAFINGSIDLEDSQGFDSDDDGDDKNLKKGDGNGKRNSLSSLEEEEEDDGVLAVPMELD